ncbi:hypothetical protein C8R43DRAFT_1032883 [Mycena crocata]|nr:hypothetical protein C8R43DRAFT_1032883 [Mycena crocata]
MSAPAQNLPTEVIDFIVEGNRGDKRSLASCSLVCKAWLASSRYQLFSEFDVYVGPNVGASFLKLLHHPLCTFVYCIRNISIYPANPDANGVADLGEKTISGLAKLTHVDSLRMFNHRGRIPKETLAHLASTFSEVTTLRMSNVFPCFNDAIEFTGLFPSLKSLDFYPYCVDSAAASATVPGTALPPKLSSLQLHSPFTHRAWFLANHEHFPSLTLYQVGIRATDTAVVKEILTAFGADLHNLSINFADPKSALDFSAAVNYTCNTRLSSLEIKTPWSVPFLPMDTSEYSASVSFLNTLRAPNLRVLTWSLKVHERELSLWRHFPWAEIDGKLSDRAVFRSLKEFHVCTNSPFPAPVRDRLPKCDAVGIKLHISTSI